MSDVSEEAIAAFLVEVGRLVREHVTVPNFDDLFDVDDEANGPGLVRATPDDIEAAVVMGLQRAVIEQETALEEARFGKQSEVIAETHERAETPTLPGENVRVLAGVAAMQQVDDAIDAAQEASRKLGDAFGKPHDIFQACADEANDAIAVRDRTIDEVNEAAAKILSERLARLAAVMREFDAQKATMAPEVKGILETKGNARGAPKNLKAGLENAGSAVAAMDAGAHSSGNEGFDGLERDAREAVKSLTGLIRNVNAMAFQTRGEARKDRVASTVIGTAPPAADLEMLPASKHAAEFQAASAKHAEAYKKLAALPVQAPPEMFDTDCKATEALRDDAQELLLALRKEISDEKGARQARHKQLLSEYTGLPGSKAKNGTTEYKDFAKAKSETSSTLARLDLLCGAGARPKFEDADTKAVASIDALRQAIQKADLDAEAREQKVTVLKQQLAVLAQSLNADFPAAGALPNDDIRRAALAAFQKRRQEIVPLITGIDDQEDQKQAQIFREYVQKTKDFGAEIKRISASEWTRNGANMHVPAQMKAVADTLKSSGIGEAATNDVKALRTLVRALDENSRFIRDLAPRVTTATTTNAAVLPDQQLILATYAADTAQTQLDQLDATGLDLLYKKFSAAVRAIEQQAAEDAAAATPMGQFLTLYATNRATNQALVLATLNGLLNAHTAVVAGGRDAYQCDNETGGDFSIERELRIGGLSGVLIHAHCQPNGTVKNGNGFHIKLAANRHQRGQGVMLTGPSRATLLAAFARPGNLAEKNATPGVVWQ